MEEGMKDTGRREERMEGRKGRKGDMEDKRNEGRK